MGQRRDNPGLKILFQEPANKMVNAKYKISLTKNERFEPEKNVKTDQIVN